MRYEDLKAVWAELTAEGAPFEVIRTPIGRIDVLCYRNAPHDLRTLWLSTQAFAEREYLIYQDERITYGEAHRRVNTIAAWLVGEGVKPCDRVGIAMRNYPEWLLIYWACVSMGVAVVGMNAWWVGEEIDFAIEDSGPKVIFCDAERLARILERTTAGAAARLVAVRTADIPLGVTPFKDVLAAEGALPDVVIDRDQDACIFYTSGTTGLPKGAQLTHRGCVSNLMSLMFAAQVGAMAANRTTGASPDAGAPVAIPTALVTTPLFHVTANNCVAYAATAIGGKLVLMHRWDPKTALILIEREKATTMGGVPVMSRELISHPDFDKHDLSSLVTLGGGGAQLPPDLVHRIDETLPNARPNTGYGMTETSGIIAAVSADFFVDKPASVGPAMPDYEVKCVDDHGATVPQGELGELWVRGAQVIKGYLNLPEATAEAITDGWLHTGDIARIDADGFIFIVDRKKDMLLRGGENVYCAEVEAAFYRHDSVAEVCVFGVDDERLGEEVGAAVVLRKGFTITAQDLRSHCAAHIAGYKVPRYIWILHEPLPRNANGKFLRRDLQACLKITESA